MFVKRFRGKWDGPVLQPSWCTAATAPRMGGFLEELPQKTIALQRVSAERARAILSDLGLGVVPAVTDANSLALSGPPVEMEKAAIVLDLVDTDEDYVVQKLAPRRWPGPSPPTTR